MANDFDLDLDIEGEEYEEPVEFDGLFVFFTFDIQV